MYRTLNLFVTHYDDTTGKDVDTIKPEDVDIDKAPEGKLMTQPQIDQIVEKRVAKMKQQNRQTLTQLETLQSSAKMDTEGRATLEAELEELRIRTLSQDEIQKRDAKKVADKYSVDLKTAQQDSTVWQDRYNNLRIKYEINTAASKNKVVSQSLGMVESFLRPNTKLVENQDDKGKGIGTFEPIVDFDDVNSEGKAIVVQMSVPDTIKRMSELPEKYGNLFEGQKISGTGGSSGSSGSSGTIDPSKMSTEEYLKFRKENPRAALGIVG